MYHSDLSISKNNNNNNTGGDSMMVTLSGLWMSVIVSNLCVINELLFFSRIVFVGHVIKWTSSSEVLTVWVVHRDLRFVCVIWDL